MTPILILSGLVILAGIMLFRNAIKGRLVSDHPYCRSCKFDLFGLELNCNSLCPECGQPTIPDTPMVMSGLHKSRPIMVICALLIIFSGGLGIAWPKVSQLSTIKNIDWYAKFPEGLLIRLADSGNKDAFQELHDRLLLGTLSDGGLESMTDQAFKILDDEATPWDSRWGDALIIACAQKKLDKEQLEHYAERSVEITVKSHQQAQITSTKLLILVDSSRPNRGSGRASYSVPQSSSYQLRLEKFSASIDGVVLDVPSRFLYGIAESFNRGEMESWTPYQQSGYGVAMPIQLEAVEPGEQRLEFIFEFNLLDGDTSIHTWEVRTQGTVERRENSQYASFEDDSEKIKSAVEAIGLSQFMVPSDPEAIAKDKNGQSTYVNLCITKNDSQPPLYLMGRVVFQIDEMQLEYGLTRVHPGGGGLSARPTRGYASNWWQYYIDHAEFWDKVAEKGSMDVLIYPDLSIAKQSFDFERVVPQTVRFSDVPVEFYLFSSAQTPDENKLTNSVISNRGSRVFQEFVQAELVGEDLVVHQPKKDRPREQAILDSMAMERVNVYTKLEQARIHGLDYLRNIPISLQLSSAQQYSLHGEVYFRVGKTELYFGEIDWEIEENLTQDIKTPNLSYPGDDPIGYYQNNPAFWDQAINLGRIDVIIRPHQGEEFRSSFTQRPFIFQGLAIETYSPEMDSRGNGRWNWQPANQFPSYPLKNPVTARFLDDE